MNNINNRLKKIFFILLLIVLLIFIKFIYKTNPQNAIKKINKLVTNLQTPFILNKGQIDKKIIYYSKIKGGAIYINQNGDIIYSFSDINKQKKYVVRENFFNCLSNKISANNKTVTEFNYFKGKNKDKWHTSIPSYNTINFNEIYKGIKLKFEIINNNLEKIFYLSPNADPSQILINYSENFIIKKNGELKLDKTNLSFTKPIAYQIIKGEKKQIRINYKIIGNKIGFDIGKYDKNNVLIIDPLIASTYIGGNNQEFITGIKEDSEGNYIISGYTTSSDFPITKNVYDSIFQGDAGYTETFYITKIKSDLTTVLSSTFLCGGNYNRGGEICLDNQDNVYITGLTYNSDFPITENAYDSVFREHTFMGFVSKLNKNLNKLIGSTFIGGNNDDNVKFISLSNNGIIYISGETKSNDFPISPSAFCNNFINGHTYIFISALDTSLSSLYYSTLIGCDTCDENDDVYSMAIDKNNNIYIAGLTQTKGFPLTNNAVYKEFQNGDNAFIMKLSPDLSILKASTLFGYGYCYNMIIDDFCNIYVEGLGSTTTPMCNNSYIKKYTPNSSFISKLDSNLSLLKASTYVNNIYIKNIKLNNKGYIYALGGTSDSNFEITMGAFSSELKDSCGGDIAIVKLNNSLTNLYLSTFFGGTNRDVASKLLINKDNQIVFCGQTNSNDLPLSPNAFCSTYVGGTNAIEQNCYDCFISVLDSNLSDDITAVYTKANTGGSIEPSGIIEITDTVNITFNIIPNSGYKICNVIVDNESIGIVNSYTFKNIYFDHFIEAKFDTIAVTINEIDNNYKIINNIFPNPFKNIANILITINSQQLVNIAIYNISGKLVKTLNDKILTQGKYQFKWDGTNNNNSKLSSGIYYCKLTTKNNSETKNVILLR